MEFLILIDSQHIRSSYRPAVDRTAHSSALCLNDTYHRRSTKSPSRSRQYRYILLSTPMGLLHIASATILTLVIELFPSYPLLARLQPTVSVAKATLYYLRTIRHPHYLTLWGPFPLIWVPLGHAVLATICWPIYAAIDRRTLERAIDSMKILSISSLQFSYHKYYFKLSSFFFLVKLNIVNYLFLISCWLEIMSFNSYGNSKAESQALQKVLGKKIKIKIQIISSDILAKSYGSRRDLYLAEIERVLRLKRRSFK